MKAKLHYFAIDYFLRDTDENFVSTVVMGPRKREVGRLVPAQFTEITKELCAATILSDILNKKIKHTDSDLSFDDSKTVKRSICK